MKNPEKNISSQVEIEAESERRVRLISQYIEEKIIGANKTIGEFEKEGQSKGKIEDKADEEKEIEKYYETMSPREKADALYLKIMAYMTDKQVEKEMKEEAKNNNKKYTPDIADPYLISEIKVLFGDKNVKKLISEKYGEARIDAKKLRLSELGTLWSKTNEDIAIKEKAYRQLEQNLHLEEISGQGKISSAKSRMARLAENLTDLRDRKKNLETLKGFPEISENTDIAANFQYENLKEYKKQLDRGFVWLPSRKKIHQQTVSAILNHRQPLLIGEAGSGKSEQAIAAAIELTGHPPTKIECESTTGEKQLIKDKEIDSKTGGSYDEYGPIMEAFTGYEDSRQEKPKFSTGRIARLDEAGRLGEKSYSILKRTHQDQKKPGADFYGRPVLAGAGVVGTTNPPGPRYPGRRFFDPAMRREWSEIPVPYPDMSNENPELYEFMLTALLDENNHIAAAKEEIAPAYQKKEISEDQRKTLEDGSIIIAKDEMIENIADSKHGALWRFSGAIKALQDSFVYGNAETEKYPDVFLRFKEDADGNIDITDDGSGEPLVLSTSTVTLGELASWMSGFNERKQKQDEEFRVDTLTQWLDFKVSTYLKQADGADRGKIKAIFKHFHFLENNAPNLSNAKPLTPKEIGYLSPRVLRPVYLEKPAEEQNKEGEKEEESAKEEKEYETKQVLLENGVKILIKESEFVFKDEEFTVNIGDRFRLNKDQFSFAGIVEDEASEHNGKPVGQLAGGEKLYMVFSSQELSIGILEEFRNVMIQEVEDLDGDLDDFKELE